MKQVDETDVERSSHWGEASYAWPQASNAAPAQPKPSPVAFRWVRDGNPALARKTPKILSIRADHPALDERCRGTLQKLIRAGCTRAGHPCSLEQFQVAEDELKYLGRHGLVHAEGSALLQLIIRSCDTQKSGADVGKITVVLNVNLW